MAGAGWSGSSPHAMASFRDTDELTKHVAARPQPSRCRAHDAGAKRSERPLRSTPSTHKIACRLPPALPRAHPTAATRPHPTAHTDRRWTTDVGGTAATDKSTPPRAHKTSPCPSSVPVHSARLLHTPNPADTLAPIFVRLTAPHSNRPQAISETRPQRTPSATLSDGRSSPARSPSNRIFCPQSPRRDPHSPQPVPGSLRLPVFFPPAS